MTQGSLGSRRLVLRALLIPLLAATAVGCSDSTTTTTVDQPPAAGTVRVHYHRNDNTYTGWGIYSWEGPTTPTPTWPATDYNFTTADNPAWGNHVDVPMVSTATQFSFLIINNGTKDCGSDEHFALPADIATKGAEIWVLSGDCTIHTSQPPIVYVNLGLAQAVWLDPTTLVWPGVSGGTTYQMYLAANGGMTATDAGLAGGDGTPISLTTTTLSADLQAKYPQFASAPAFSLAMTVADAKTALKGQVAVVAVKDGKAIAGTSVQIAPIVDAIYADAAGSAELGVTFASNVPTFSLWAPTAKSVKLNLFADHAAAVADTKTTVDMVEDTDTGVWSYTAADASLTNVGYYTFDVQVFSRAASRAVVTNTVTDPYSTSLDGNSKHSMVLDLTADLAKPAGFDAQPLIATSATPTDAVIYELHVRDFSANDPSLADPANKGKFKAFTDTNADGYKHLKKLADAGLTHVHLLPAFDFATTDELACVQDVGIPAVTGDDLAYQTALFATTTDQPTSLADRDCFNWGYDPMHYGVPEGSYSSAPDDGVARVKEFREMVAALHAAGLRVLMDVVYNHTNSAGQDTKAVLDRIVPDYYNRLDGNGSVSTYACCADTATEHAMMGKLMTETLVRWADQYKVDGFRFDLMGTQPKQLMVDALATVNAVVAGDARTHTYFYGEGWLNGSTDAMFTGANQLNMGGTGIGTFNDRIRDAVRGGAYNTSGSNLPDAKGFTSGLCVDPVCTGADLTTAMNRQKWLEIGLAGNLAAFPLNGSQTGHDVDYNTKPAGYTSMPSENISYVSAHDNETLWDIVQYKHADDVTPADRARAQIVGLSTSLLSEGVAFIHAGEDLLRSKSEDGNSYNSGDYFNRIYWDGSSNNWAVGAPPQNTSNNATNLPQIQHLFANTNTFVDQAIINGTSDVFADFLSIRKDTTMFQLTTAQQVIDCVRFPDQGLGMTPGVITMQIGDGTTSCGDNKYASVVVVFNGTPTSQNVDLSWYHGRAMALHAIQAAGHDTTVQGATFDGTKFTVPARTTAVFVENPTNAFTGGYATMYVRGDMNGWGTTNPMKLVAPNVWQTTIALATNDDGTAKGYGFKFDTGDWSNNWPSSNANLTVSAAGNYVFIFDDNAKTFVVLPPVWFPGQVTDATAAALAGNLIKVTWTPVGGATAYDVYRTDTDGGTFAPVGTVTAAEFDDAGLTEGTKYYYQVVAKNALFTAPVSATTSATATSGGAPTCTQSHVYMNGNFTSPAWAAPAHQALECTADHTWTITLTLSSAQLAMQWKFDNDDNWGTTSGTGVAWTSADTGMTGTCHVSATGEANISVTLAAAGNYVFTFHEDTLGYSVAAAP